MVTVVVVVDWWWWRRRWRFRHDNCGLWWLQSWWSRGGTMTAAKTAVATYELLVRSLSLSARRSALTFPAQKYQIMINTDYGALCRKGQ